MKIVAFKRTEQGTGASRRLRRSGQTPGILYGGVGQPMSITLDHNTLYHALKKEAFHSSVHDIEIDGKAEQVLLRDFQIHAFKQIVLHVDFERVDANKKLHTKVPLHFINAENSPAVKLSAAMINHVLNELEISCLPADLPEFITVDLSTITAGQSLHLSNVNLPKGVTAIVHADDPTVATAIVPKGGSDEEGNAGDVAAPTVGTDNKS